MGLPLSTETRYTEGLLAGIAARGISGWQEWTDVFGYAAGFAALDPVAGDRAEEPFDLRAKLDECAAADRAPDADEKRHFGEYGFNYLGPDKDGFAVRIELPANGLQACALRELAVICQQLANGSVEIDEQGGINLRVVSVCDAPEALRQIEAAGLKTFGLPCDAGGIVTLHERLLSSQMLLLAGVLDAQGAANSKSTSP